MKIYNTNSPEETFKLGSDFAKKAVPGQIITLDGDLGCGKTVFAKGFANGLGITEEVTSPTFTIVQVYEDGRLPLYHFDVYRIMEPDEMYETGLDEYLFGNGVSLIEWAGNISEILPENIIRINIKKDNSVGFEHRIIEVEDPLEEVEDEASGN